MHRPTRQHSDAPGHDSFLDIVANMVGILIILVMVVGVRIKNAPVVAALSSGAAYQAPGLEEDRAVEESLRDDVLEATDEIRRIQEETQAQGRQRDALAATVRALEQNIRSRRQQMDAQTQEKLDLEGSLSELRFRLDQLDGQRAEADTVRAEPIVVKSYPTPLSQTVDRPEAHFRLHGGRVALVPLDQLVDQLKEDAGRQKYKLLDLPELTDTVGPLGGFRLRYTLERREISPEMAMLTGRGGSYAQLRRWTLIPVSSQIGEPLQMALADGSEFRESLSKFRPQRTTITIWTYPESFAEFRQIKKELYRLGFSVAARPLPEGIPISGSPEGSKSAAQ